jgi:hypothetical protein
MQLDLIDCRHHTRTLDEGFQLLCAEIRHADRAHPTFGKQFGHGTVRPDGLFEVRWHRPVEKIEIEIVEPQPVQARIEGAQGAFVTVSVNQSLVVTNISGPINAAARKCFTDRALASIRGRGIDQAVAVGDRRLDGTCHAIERVSSQRAEPERRHPDAVVQSNKRGFSSDCLHSVLAFDLQRFVLIVPSTRRRQKRVTDHEARGGLHSQRMAAAIFSGRPRHPSGISFITAFIVSGSSASARSTIGVWTLPRQTALMRMPLAAYSRAALFVRGIGRVDDLRGLALLEPHVTRTVEGPRGA